MKLKALMDHMPVYQYVILQEKLKTVAEGFKNDPDILQYGDKTVGLFHCTGDFDNAIVVSVYDRKGKDD